MGSIKHAKTSPVPNPLGDTRRVGGGDWNSEHVIDLEVADIAGLEARLIPVEQVEQFRDDALAFRNEAAGSASDAAASAAAAAAEVGALAAPGGAELVGAGSEGTVRDALDGRVKQDALSTPATVPAYAFSAAEAQSIFDNALPLQDYAELLAYNDRAVGVRIVGLYVTATPDIRAGFFQYNPSAPNTSNGGTQFAHASGVGAWQRVFSGAVHLKWFQPVGNGTANDFAALDAALLAAVLLGAPLHIDRVGSGLYFIGTNELVISASGITITHDSGVEIRGNGSTDGGYIVSFARSGGTGQPSGAHPVNQNITGMRVRSVAPFSTAPGRAAIRLCGSYSTLNDCGAVTSADPSGNGFLFEADDSGSGPYYNSLNECSLQGPQSGTQTGTGYCMRQKAGTAIATRLPNTNSVWAGRVGGYLVNIELAGTGNRYMGVSNENSPGYGTAHKWVFTVANSNASNLVFSPYVENAATGFAVDPGCVAPTVDGTGYLTGITTLISDPSGVLDFKIPDGIRNMRLPSTSTSGIFVGNTANADPKTFDWYEEVIFTPVMKGSTTLSTGTTHNVQVGRATRKGNRLSINLACSWTASTETGNIVIDLDDLPWAFSAISNTNSVLNIRSNNLLWSAGKQLVAYSLTGTKRIQLEQIDPAGGAVSGVPMDTNASVFITGEILL